MNKLDKDIQTNTQFRETVLISIMNLSIFVTLLAFFLSLFLKIPAEGLVSTAVCLAFLIFVRILGFSISYKICAIIYLSFIVLILPVNHYFTYPNGQGAIWWYSLLPLACVFFLGKKFALGSSLLVGVLAASMDLYLIYVWGYSGNHKISSSQITDAIFHAISIFLSGAIAYYFEKNREIFEESLVAARDVIRKTLEHKEEVEKHLNETNKLGNIGGWSLNVKSGELWWSDQTYRIHEIDIGSEVKVNEAIKYYAEEARPIITAAVDKAIQYGEGWDLELPFVTAKGNKIWVRAAGVAVSNSIGTISLRGSIQDITERKVNEEKLTEAKEEALRAVVAKSMFLASMSHEIRTPMNGVLGNADLLLDGENDEARKKIISNILKSGESMMQILNDILDYSKIDAGRLTLDVHPFDLHDQLQSVFQLFEGRSAEKNIDLILEIDENTPKFVSSDSTRLKQILSNLISNAIKFTKQGIVVLRTKCLNCEKDFCLVRFEVEDTGIGIDQKSLKDLFNDFTQADVSTSRKFGGTGLGLAICKRLADLLGSHIIVKSKLGIGTRFFFDLGLKIETNSENLNGRQNKLAAKVNNSFAGLRILLVEDNEINSELATNFLKRIGVEYHLANNGSEAVEVIKKQPFDLILMDCLMPVMDGYEATKAIRLMNLSKQPIIIAMTANAMREDEKKCLDSGMDDYISKPISRTKLNTILSKWNAHINKS